MRNVWQRIFWKQMTDKARELQACFTETELHFRGDCTGLNTKNAIKS